MSRSTRACTIGRLPEEIDDAGALRTEDQPVTIGRPQRITVNTRAGRDAGERRPD